MPALAPYKPTRNFNRPFAAMEYELAFPSTEATIDLRKDSAATRRVQEWLLLSDPARKPGDAVPARKSKAFIDGDYGPVTEAALAPWQPGGAPSPILGVDAWMALTTPMRHALAASSDSARSLGEEVAFVARAWLAAGLAEVGGPNKGPSVRAMMLGFQGEKMRWCAGFVSHCLAQACHNLSLPMPFRPSFGCKELAKYAKNAGRFSAKGPAVPGDVFVIPDSDGGYFHTGIVLEWEEPRFFAAEGNTNTEGSADGEVARLQRRRGEGCDFLRVTL